MATKREKYRRLRLRMFEHVDPEEDLVLKKFMKALESPPETPELPHRH
jgi:hypothetical protein